MPGRGDVVAVLIVVSSVVPRPASPQTVVQRGFVEVQGLFFPQRTPNDSTRVVGDFLLREEVFVKPTPWLRFAGGVDVRANSHEQIEDDWRVDLSDRGVRRPRISIRRATATFTSGRLTVDVGKQFIRWGKTDIINPTDRFAPRDFLNVVDGQFLAVTGARGVVRAGEHDTLEVVWLPRFTPSRVPLLNQRWTALPASDVRLLDAGARLPQGAQTGLRWNRAGTRVEGSLSFFDGFNYLPNVDVHLRVPPAAAQQTFGTGVGPEVDVARVYPALRAFGADVALPTHWFSVKAETAYFTSSSPMTDQYVLYVIQLERQTGEWVFVGGYAGEMVTARRAMLTFAPDRGMTKAAVGRASYAIDSTRSLAFETAVRQSLSGAYFKGEYSQSYGQHWRATVAGAAIRGEADDFLGQYRLNSHLSFVLRYSF